MAHGARGAVFNAVQGGKAEHGFTSGFLGAVSGAATSSIGSNTLGAVTARTAIAAAIGGSASSLGGGSFASGAVTSSFTVLFNDIMHDGGGGPGDPPKKVRNVHQVGATFSAAYFGGIMVEIGFSWSDLRDISIYWTQGIGGGNDLSLGVMYTLNQSDHVLFSTTHLEGPAVVMNGGVGVVDFGRGWNYTDTSNPVNATYNTLSGGLSVGQPAGFMVTHEETFILGTRQWEDVKPFTPTLLVPFIEHFVFKR